MEIDFTIAPKQLVRSINRLFDLSAQKILALEKSWDPKSGTPVFTVAGKYITRGWTEWTQGFQFGSALLQYEATGNRRFLELGRSKTLQLMATHVSHMGVHDHGFNNVSTYGNLLRLMNEGKIAENERERQIYELALKVSGAVQAARWTDLGKTPKDSPSLPSRERIGVRGRFMETVEVGPRGYIYSFNGPHSLFIDTFRSLRSLALAHRLGHVLMGERDCRISLLDRLIQHALTTAEFSIYYGTGRDAYDTVPGRVAHESIFNINDGSYRCPNSQQGYSPFTTWMRGLAWAICGFAEQLEFLKSLTDEEFSLSPPSGERRPARRSPGEGGGEGFPRNDIIATLLRAAKSTADFYLGRSCADGIPMWDSGAPNLHRLGDYLARPADPFNAWEPVDSSAAAIAAQGLLRLGTYLSAEAQRRRHSPFPPSKDERAGERRSILALAGKYFSAGLTIARTLFHEPYLSTSPQHQGLLLHSVYHRPNGWDHIAPGQKVPNGESSMWGDYHLRELALMILRTARGEKYLTFFGGLK